MQIMNSTSDMHQAHILAQYCQRKLTVVVVVAFGHSRIAFCAVYLHIPVEYFFRTVIWIVCSSSFNVYATCMSYKALANAFKLNRMK